MQILAIKGTGTSHVLCFLVDISNDKFLQLEISKNIWMQLLFLLKPLGL